MSWLGSAATLAGALLLTACASVPREPAPPEGGERLAGRLAVRIAADQGNAARSENAGFELQGTAEAGRMNLSTPLGSVLAQARWTPESVWLVTPKGERRYSDLDDLTRDVLGESLPVAALFDWMHGRPWPGAASQASVVPPGFTQLGWAVDLAGIADGLIVARRDRAPGVTVRAKLDR